MKLILMLLILAVNFYCQDSLFVNNNNQSHLAAVKENKKQIELKTASEQKSVVEEKKQKEEKKQQAASQKIPTWKELEQKSNNPEITKLTREVEKLVEEYKYAKPSSEVKNQIQEEKKVIPWDKLTYNEKKLIKKHGENYYWKRLQPKYNKYHSKRNKFAPGSKEDLAYRIESRLVDLFNIREEEKQSQIEKLEREIKELKSILREREKNKRLIVEERLRELLGKPDFNKW